ncbi:MAG TPA: DUF5672 family protein [Verrucomicrobiae bacterium]|nr:DUF5672 family protein [Verrucomicrobiae bacterium]
MKIGSEIRRHGADGPSPSKLVAVVVPLSARPEFTADELISLRHLTHYLGRHDRYMIAPRNGTSEYPGFTVLRFPNRFFGSPAAHDRLMLWPKFYETFRDYKYILCYHLDSLVFSDQLEQWCGMDWDYIGPPWLKCPELPWVDVERVGNIGFALLKVDSFLKVLYSPRYQTDPDEYWRRHYAGTPPRVRLVNLPKKYLKRLPVFNSVRWQMRRWLLAGQHSDTFWSDQAKKYNPEFRIADVGTSLRFAFEAAPRICFERTNRTLPFGCHAWARYDRAFWEPYLLPKRLACAPKTENALA